jgi:hypothetical protein
MQGSLITLGIIAAILALVLKPKHSLALYLAILIWVPDYLRISIGTIDISTGRIVAAALLLRCINDRRIMEKFHWMKLDKAVVLSMIVYTGVTLLVQPTWASIENRSGFIMDTWFAYMVSRFIITDREKLISVIKCVSIALVPLAILGCMEALTGWQPFVPLRRFRPWNPEYITTVGTRWGITRATGPFGHSILFGCNFAMFLPLIYSLRHEKDIWKSLAYILSLIAIIGALSSMSSGPWVMIIVVLFCLAIEKYAHWTMLMLKVLIFGCVLIQVLSNRNFYHVIFSYASKFGGTGWHRARLIDLAIAHFNDWWLAGYGGKDPGWGYYLGNSWTDVTNEFILAGVKYGLAGIIVLCYVLYVAFSSLRAAYKKENQPYMKSMYWSLGSFLFAVVVTWMSISFFGQLMPLFYCLLGVTGACVMFRENQQKISRRAAAIRKHNDINSEEPLLV